jgi:hypothetical protein
MEITLLGWHYVWNHALIDGYNVVKQTRGKRQRYTIYEEADLTVTRIARDLNHDAALGMLKILLACANSQLASNG